MDPTDAGPIPLRVMPNPSPIPLDAFPSWVSEFIRGLAVEHQVPTDFPALFVLGVTAVGGGGRVWVQVPDTNWREPTNLYVAAALPSGFGKTPVINQIRQPLTATAEQLAAEALPALQRNATLRTVLRARLKTTERAAAAAETDTDRDRLVTEAIDPAGADPAAAQKVAEISQQYADASVRLVRYVNENC
jgi:hypothetical protein